MPVLPGQLASIVKRDSEVWFMPVWKDRNGNPIQNSAKGPFPKPVVEPVSIGIYRATVRKATFTDTDYKTQLNAINSDAWRAYSAGQAWVSRIITNNVNENGQDITIVDYVVRCCEYGWKALIPQFGYYYNNSGVVKVFADSDGNPYLGALNASGGVNPIASDLVIAEFDVKRAIAFSTSLGF